MSLDWSIRKVRDNEEIIDDGLEANITQAIVFHTMAIDMGEITEDNWQEFYARIALMEKHVKPSITVPDMVEYKPLVVEPPEGTRYVEVDGTFYHYNGVIPDWYDDDTDSVVIALDLDKYESGPMGPIRGPNVIYVPDSDTETYYHAGFKPKPITPQDVHRRIGLSTNVATVSRAKWSKRMMDYWLDEGVKRAARNVSEA